MADDLVQILQGTVGKHLTVARFHLEDQQADFDKLQQYSIICLERLVTNYTQLNSATRKEIHTLMKAVKSADWATKEGIKSVYVPYCKIIGDPLKKYF